jgi:hypothetical protein
LLDEIDRMPNAPYRVNMPTDPRLLRVCRAILADPSDSRDLDDSHGASRKTAQIQPGFEPPSAGRSRANRRREAEFLRRCVGRRL